MYAFILQVPKGELACLMTLLVIIKVLRKKINKNISTQLLMV